MPEGIRKKDTGKETVNALERLMASLAGELHDNAGQKLAVLRLSLEEAALRMKGGGPAAERCIFFLQKASLQVQDLQKDLRRLARGLYPAGLELSGLPEALRELCSSVGGVAESGAPAANPSAHQECPPFPGGAAESGAPAANLSVHLKCPRLPSGGRDIALSLYRIAQEALTNIVRHAEASEVFLSLSVHEKVISLTIEDDGRGFIPPREYSAAHLGLRLMRERARSCGGTVTLDSAPGRGALVLVEIPLRGTPQ